MNDSSAFSESEAEVIQQARHLLDGGELWSADPYLVVRNGAEFPDRCLCCNGPAQGYRLRQTISWSPDRWRWLALVTDFLTYRLAANLIETRGRVGLPICPRHRSERRRAILGGWLGGLAGLAIIVIAAVLDTYQGIIAFGAALAVMSFYWGMSRAELVSPESIDANFVWLSGVSREFLATLPEWSAGPDPGPRRRTKKRRDRRRNQP